MAVRWTSLASLTRRASPNYWDVIAFTMIVAVFVVIANGSRGMVVALPPPGAATVSLHYGNLPHYALRTVLRMFIALAFSFLFTFTYATLAAKSRRAEMVLIPILDVLQSVPVLGFLSFTVTVFTGAFPGSTLGPECAAIFAIFTSQAWNMAFSFYQSLRTVPRDLDEVARDFRLTPWQRFLVSRSCFCHSGTALEHDDVHVRGMVFRRCVRGHLRREHDHQAAWHRLVSGACHRGATRRRRRRGCCRDVCCHPPLRPTSLPSCGGLGKQVPRRALGLADRRGIVGPAHLSARPRISLHGSLRQSTADGDRLLAHGATGDISTPRSG